MTTELFREMDRRARAVLGAELGCGVKDFEREELRVVCQERPGGKEEHVALAITFGTGTVVSVVPELLEWVEANRPPDHHYRAMHHPFLTGLQQEAMARGVACHVRYPGLGFLPAEPLRKAGQGRLVTTRRVEGEELDRLREGNVFDNALGDGSHLTAYAWVAEDQSGTAVAVAGVFAPQTVDLYEIGVDVARGARGTGLAPAVVRAAAEAILSDGGVPFYTCAPTNVRSHRTALACGFLPAFSLAGIRRDPTPAPD